MTNDVYIIAYDLYKNDVIRNNEPFCSNYAFFKKFISDNSEYLKTAKKILRIKKINNIYDK